MMDWTTKRLPRLDLRGFPVARRGRVPLSCHWVVDQVANGASGGVKFAVYRAALVMRNACTRPPMLRLLFMPSVSG